MRAGPRSTQTTTAPAGPRIAMASQSVDSKGESGGISEVASRTESVKGTETA
jgi:hypothetical protein